MEIILLKGSRSLFNCPVGAGHFVGGGHKVSEEICRGHDFIEKDLCGAHNVSGGLLHI